MQQRFLICLLTHVAISACTQQSVTRAGLSSVRKGEPVKTSYSQRIARQDAFYPINHAKKNRQR